MPESSIVLVTGGAKGVGCGISERFLAAGATVIACGRERPAALPRAAGREAEFISADLRDAAAREALIAAVIERHGRLDVLVNNAGGTPFKLTDAASPQYHDKVMQLNLLAPLHLAQLANAQMRQQSNGGVIVFIASVSGLRSSPGTAIYGAAKAGVLNLVQSLAIEWAPKVRVVAVTPGPVETEQSALHYGDAAGISAVAATIPLQRLARPEDVGDACVWLASSGAAYVSGSNLLLHGGGERPAFLAAATVNQK